MKINLSEQTSKIIKEIATKAANNLCREMAIVGIDHLKLSLDINFNSTGKVIGVKVSGLKAQTFEMIYDEEPCKNEVEQ